MLAFGAYLGVQLLRFAKPPTIAVTDPATAVVEVDEATTDLHAARHDHRRAPRSSIATPGRDPYQRQRRTRPAPGRPTSSCAAGETSSRSSALDPDTGKRSEETIALLHHRPVPGHRGADADRRSADRGGDRSRTARSRSRAGRPTPRPSSSAPTYSGPSAPVAEARRAPPAPPAVPAPITVDRRRGRRVQHPARTDRRPLGDHGHRVQPGGQDHGAHAQRHGRYQGVNLVVNIKGGRAWLKVWVDGKLDARLGAGGSVIAQRQDAHVHRQGIGRGPDRIVRRDLLHAQRDVAWRAGAVRASRRPGCSPRRTHRTRPSAADGPMADDPLARPGGTPPGCVPGAAAARRDRRVLHRRSRRSRDHRACRARAAYYLGGFVTYADAAQARPGRASRPRSWRRTAPCRPRSAVAMADGARGDWARTWRSR